MKTRLQQWRERYWTVRPLTERRLIVLAALILLPPLCYLLLWQPAHQAVARLERQLPLLRVQAARLHQQASEVEALRHRPQPAQLDATTMRQVLEESAERLGLRAAFNVIEIQPPNAVRINSEAIDFARWVGWVRELQSEQHLRLESVALSALSEPGMVKLTAIFSADNPL